MAPAVFFLTETRELTLKPSTQNRPIMGQRFEPEASLITFVRNQVHFSPLLRALKRPSLMEGRASARSAP